MLPTFQGLVLVEQDFEVHGIGMKKINPQRNVQTVPLPIKKSTLFRHLDVGLMFILFG